MDTLHKRPYLPPFTNEFHFVTDEICIGFGEGSIPPEDSDCNNSWLDDDPTCDLDLSKSNIRLWDE